MRPSSGVRDLMELQRLLVLSFLAAFPLLAHVHAQSQSGFISIDCGLPGNSSYREPLTGLTYVSDSAYIDTGEPRNVSDLFMTNTLQQQLATVRTFPQGARNCYKVSVKVGTRYLVRASFLYADFDGRNTTPSSFDLHVGPNFWATVALPRVAAIQHEEIIHISASNYAQVCLVNTGSGTPFISSLEFRPLRNDTYSNLTQSLQLVLRLDVGSNSPAYRYPSDVYDRVWSPAALRSDWTSINTSSTIAVDDPLGYFSPSVVLSTASTPLDTSAKAMDFTIQTSHPQSVAYLYFAEVAQLQTNQTRSFRILLNGAPLLNEVFSPVNLSETVVYTRAPVSNTTFMFSLQSTTTSTLPPLLNALEIYTILNLPESATDQEDVDAIASVKSTYGVVKNWQGDPCAPVDYVWQGVTCNSARITGLDLSSSGLTGAIVPDILNLQMLETLDLSNNNLTGPVLDFLSQMPQLKVLNLAKNNLSGSVPVSLTDRANSGDLSLNLEDNPNLSTTAPSSEKKSSNVVVAVVASIAGAIALVLIVLGALFWMRRRKEQRGAAAGRVEVDPANHQAESWEMKKHHYSYSEVVRMTDNFKQVLGEGGFGKVYYGRIKDDDTEVAVKMLSLSSSQGYQQFQAEVELLMRVHHRNLISLVGYCNEGPHMGLIYEYMSRGNLGSLLADDEAGLLTWERRLHIALDAAQGLEYLHNGSRPAMVHRDVKCTNILLNDIFQAKLADFGLTRSFPTDGGATHITATNVVGTPGYLDPEYYVSYRLNEKSDIYSFGIVILEIVTGRPVLVRNHEKSHITQWVDFTLSEGDISAIIDPRMKMDYDVNSIWKAVEVAMSSASQSSARRPTMSEVVKELKECLDIEMANKAGSRTQSSAAINDDLGSGFAPVAR